jgi:hypothetical protein
MRQFGRPLSGYTGSMAPVRLTVVSDELAAEVLCGRLRASGVACSYRKTDMAVGIGTYGGGFSVWPYTSLEDGSTVGASARRP